MCAIDDGDVRTVFFAETEGVPAEFVFGKNVSVKAAAAKITTAGDKRWRAV